jgi:hypothetical protein
MNCPPTSCTCEAGRKIWTREGGMLYNPVHESMKMNRQRSPGSKMMRWGELKPDQPMRETIMRYLGGKNKLYAQR